MNNTEVDNCYLKKNTPKALNVASNIATVVSNMFWHIFLQQGHIVLRQVFEGTFLIGFKY
jgi:hypothetical protein